MSSPRSWTSSTPSCKKTETAPNSARATNMADPAFTVGLIGDAIARSLSPALQNAAFAYHGLPDRYTLWPTTEDGLRARIQALRAPGMCGANITIPYKSAALPLVDELGHEPDVARLGALNTIVRREDGTLLGLNTDVAGFLRALGIAGFECHGADAVVLGAGGSARAVVWGLAYAGVRSLAVVNRSVERAAGLIADLRSSVDPGAQPRLVALDSGDAAVERALRAATLLVNTTPTGTDGQTSPISDVLLHPRLFVSDLIYRPTPLLRAAATRGARTQDGLEMLVQQGALAFQAWTGLPAPVDVMRRAAVEARESGT
jgi:shikimate dehydrogenase